MTTFYQYGHFSLFRTREEAVTLATDGATSPWLGQGPEPPNRLQEALNRIKEVEIDATPIFNETKSIGGWSIWSDGKVRGIRIVEVYRPEIDGRVCNFLMDRGIAIDTGEVSQAAIKFIAASRGSDSASPEWIGHIRDVLEEKEIAIGGDRGVWARRQIVKYRLKLDTEEKTVFVFTVGYFEGYA